MSDQAHDPLRHDRCPVLWTLQDARGLYEQRYACGHTAVVPGPGDGGAKGRRADADHNRHCPLMTPLLEDGEVGR